MNKLSQIDKDPRSFWRKTAKRRDPFPTLGQDVETTVLIVGGGFTGLSTARDLLKRDVDCIVMEARDIGWGASGRTGGFAVPRFKMNYSDLARDFGEKTALDLFGKAIEAVDSIAETVAEFDIDCGFQRDGHLTPAHTIKALRGLKEDQAWLRDVAGDTAVRVLDAEETADALGSPVYRGAYLDPRAACLHPKDYTHGLAAALASRGVRIFVDSPVKTLVRDDGRWLAQTPEGAVRARHVVLASNAYTTPLVEGSTLHRRIIPVSSSVITTRPLNDTERKMTLPIGLPVTDARRLVRYFRMLPTGQLLFGGRGDITGRRKDEAAYRPLEQQLAETFPHLAGIEIHERWSGKVAVTLDSFPHIGRLDEDVHYALGYGGRGVALSSIMGRRLAERIAGDRTDMGPMEDAGFGSVPFHALRRTGMQMMARYYQLRDSFEQ
ncbi:FAD-binding oxidoreductase [Roseovarius spongiae]|uniref:FAD-binding oxidoreductase n=1 Tax=Roseovarius spongiae TaxID=2320272 RepID=A0A3A8ARM1_9RHOB|nr:FAD-binding oxidoreductase [Roseovarius spongiae]RKF12676.1 FAD-binding oxidoreductase [Roseovarius spongiae]